MIQSHSHTVHETSPKKDPCRHSCLAPCVDRKFSSQIRDISASYMWGLQTVSMGCWLISVVMLDCACVCPVLAPGPLARRAFQAFGFIMEDISASYVCRHVDKKCVSDAQQPCSYMYMYGICGHLLSVAKAPAQRHPVPMASVNCTLRPGALADQSTAVRRHG